MFIHKNDIANTPAGVLTTLRAKASECRRIASTIADRQTADALRALAADYDREADRAAA